MSSIEHAKPPEQRSAAAPGGPRDDLVAALDRTPAYICEQLTSSGVDCLNLVNNYLPNDESVQQIASAAARSNAANPNGLLLLTNKRLIFVAPAPQALAWPLAQITSILALEGPAETLTAFLVEAGQSKFHLGIDADWGQKFVGFCEHAI